MIDAAQLAKAFGRNTAILKMQVAGLSHEESLPQTPYNINCLNWTVGRHPRLPGPGVGYRRRRTPVPRRRSSTATSESRSRSQKMDLMSYRSSNWLPPSNQAKRQSTQRCVTSPTSSSQPRPK